MTRRVNFSPQQRVDQPDAQAIAAFGNQDMRRYMRQVVMGRDVAANEGRVLAGFKVEPEDPGVSPRVIVKLDLGGGALGAFMGAIDQGGGTIDWGQLAGDKDGLGNLEGSAQNLLDFTGQPIATYEVKARTTFVPGILDNRAFWNPASNEEFIKPTNTRLLPQWEIAFQNHAGSEWVLLGEVAWGGVSVDTVDITDLRKFPIEGQPRNAATPAEQWAHAEQNDSDDFGVGDFDRNEDRGDGGAGLAAIWEALRALGRQVQDVKGGRESDLRHDWFSRVYAAPGRLAADPADKTTKTLRTIDVITFTCGDGVTEQGDFTGPASLHDCLRFIEDNEASLPARIHIVVKTREGANDFTWPTAVEIEDKNISIVGIGHDEPALSFLAPGKGCVVVNPVASVVAAGALLRMTGVGSLRLENFDLEPTPADEVSWIVCDLGVAFSCKNLLLNGQVAGDNPTLGKMLQVQSEGLLIEDSIITGNVFIGGRADPGFGDSGALVDQLWSVGVAKRSFFGGLLRLRHDHLSGADSAEGWWLANHLRFEGCFFADAVSQVGAEANGQIDLTGARNIAFERCDFVYHGDQTCIWGVTATTDAFKWVPIHGIDIHDCDFRLTGDATHEGTASGAGGVSGLDGTGWAVAIKATPLGTDPVNPFQCPKRIDLAGNRFRSGLLIDGSAPVISSPDAGCVVIQDCSDVWVDKNFFVDWSKPVPGQGSDVQSILRVGATLAGFALSGGQHTWIGKNYFGDFFTSGGADWGGIGRFIFVDLILLNGVEVASNVISAINASGSLNQRLGSLPSALVINTCLSPQIHHNRIVNFRDTGDPLLNTCVGIAGLNAGVRIENNEFFNCGGNNVVFEAGAIVLGLSHKDNAYYVGADITQFVSCFDDGTFGTGTTLCSHTGNWWDHTGITTAAMKLSGSNSVGMISANMFFGGTIEVVGSGGAPYFFLRGFAPIDSAGDTQPHMNLVAGYI
jgi:hypothetical protein